MNVKEAQLDMRQAYFGGAPGALVSGLIWLIAGLIAIWTSPQTSILVFFFGGMLIHPLGMLVSKLLKRSGKHKKDNPLSNLPLESTLLLFIGLFIAYSVFQVRPAWFFPIMLMIIGARYVVFSTIYGMRIYWILGLVLVAAGVGTLLFDMPFHLAAILGGAIEIIFSGVIFSMEKGKG